jgi:hypothetical protein
MYMAEELNRAFIIVMLRKSIAPGPCPSQAQFHPKSVSRRLVFANYEVG